MALKVQMFGDCTIARGENRMEDSENRSRKVWLLIAYLIYNRQRVIPQQELVELLWGEESGSANPTNALKTMLHRARNALGQLGEDAGYELIIRKSGGYAWNPQVNTRLDVDEFETLCASAANMEEEDARLECYLNALPLYRGEFLSKLSSETWVIPIAAYYRNMYVHIVLEVLPLLAARGRHAAVEELCRAALKEEPYQEELYRHLMQALMMSGKQKEVVSVYEEMSKLLLSQFGVMPSEETRSIYRQALRGDTERVIPAGELRDQLREIGPINGALLCDYDFFKVLYHLEARAVIRSGDAVHIALINMTGERGKELANRSLERAMDNLGEVLRMSLRKGDVASRCSASQYIVMLPQANYENSCMVCDRILRAFFRRYPHTPARLDYAVQPLEPST